MLSSLEIGKRALLAQRIGLDVTSNNIANVNTPGYSRRSAIMSETDPHYRNGGFYGTGAVVEKLRTYREEFFDREIRDTGSRKAGYEADERLLQRIEAILAEPSDHSLSNVINDFFNAFGELATTPEDVSLRDYLLSRAATLVDRFHTTAQQLTTVREETLNNINADIKIANGLIKEVANLNAQISNGNARGNTDTQSLVDRREAKLEELAEMMNVNVTSGKAGSINLFINGINVVTDGDAATLKVQETVNDNTGERTIILVKTDSNDNPMATITASSGRIANNIKHYNITLDDKDSSGGFSLGNGLNDLANALVQKVNEITNDGYGLDDTGNNPPGRNFFEPSVGNATAFTIAISEDVLNNPRDIPLSGAAGEPGDNTITRKISDLANDSGFLDSKTPSKYYTDFIGTIANMGNEAANGNSTSALVAEQLNSQRESVLGVSLDEEGVNLIKFQKAFEASSRIIRMSNDLLGIIVNLGR
jgi:flagellar hook-associated protein 1